MQYRRYMRDCRFRQMFILSMFFFLSKSFDLTQIRSNFIVFCLQYTHKRSLFNPYYYFSKNFETFQHKTTKQLLKQLLQVRNLTYSARSNQPDTSTYGGCTTMAASPFCSRTSFPLVRSGPNARYEYLPLPLSRPMLRRNAKSK